MRSGKEAMDALEEAVAEQEQARQKKGGGPQEQNGQNSGDDPEQEERRHVRRRRKLRLKEALLGRSRGGLTSNIAELPRSDGAGHRHLFVAAAQAYVEEHLADPLSVPDVARAVGTSPTHLTRAFRAETGLTVVSYIRHRRLQRARHLLLSSTLSITAIAAAVGIADLQAFNNACRRELGASPRDVRAAAMAGLDGPGP
jgi:transcriptional regulator GlxA family with amidase domain